MHMIFKTTFHVAIKNYQNLYMEFWAVTHHSWHIILGHSAIKTILRIDIQNWRI